MLQVFLGIPVLYTQCPLGRGGGDEMSRLKGSASVVLWLHAAVRDAYGHILQWDMSLSENNVQSGGSS